MAKKKLTIKKSLNQKKTMRYLQASHDSFGEPVQIVQIVMQASVMLGRHAERLIIQTAPYHWWQIRRRFVIGASDSLLSIDEVRRLVHVYPGSIEDELAVHQT